MRPNSVAPPPIHPKAFQTVFSTALRRLAQLLFARCRSSRAASCKRSGSFICREKVDQWARLILHHLPLRITLSDCGLSTVLRSSCQPVNKTHIKLILLTVLASHWTNVQTAAAIRLYYEGFQQLALVCPGCLVIENVTYSDARWRSFEALLASRKSGRAQCEARAGPLQFCPYAHKAIESIPDKLCIG